MGRGLSFNKKALLGLVAAAVMWVVFAHAANRQHGLALRVSLKYPPGFSHFDYADPKAIKGGALILSSVGSFDTLNPFSLKGRAPLMLGTLLFESLTEQSLDEPFAEYGLLAESIEVADDALSLTYHLNPKARFADGKPVTAADVVYSFQVLRSESASPLYRHYYRDIKTVQALDRLTVRLTFARRNPELPLISGQVPILAKHFYEGKDFARDFVTAALGSGPYVVESFEFGKYIRYRRNKNYWGRDLNLNRGKYNFDEIVVKFYRDDTVLLEGLKAGEFDFMWVNSSKQWAKDVAGEKWEKGYLIKETLKHRNTAGMQGFAFNLRRPIFQNRDVRHALSLALDFDWMNKTLFYGQYTANDSFFDNSELAAEGLPSPPGLALLEPLRQHLPPAVFTEPVEALGKPHKNIRERLRAAQRLLNRAGWESRNGVLTEIATGRQMRFTITLSSPSFARIVEPYIVNLRKLGVQAAMKVVDESIYEGLLRTHNFDMTVQVFPQSQSPGNEQRDFWHSAAADEEGSRNIIGIKNPAVDALVEAIITAPTRRELITATHALDRVLWHEHYVVPHWFSDHHRITYWNKFSYPKKLPHYFSPVSHLMYWWVDPEKERVLTAAIAANRAVVRKR